PRVPLPRHGLPVPARSRGRPVRPSLRLRSTARYGQSRRLTRLLYRVGAPPARVHHLRPAPTSVGARPPSTRLTSVLEDDSSNWGSSAISAGTSASETGPAPSGVRSSRRTRTSRP